MTEQTDIDVGVIETARSGQGAELSGDAAEQLKSFVFSSVPGVGPAKGIEAAGEVFAGESVQQRDRVEVGVAKGHEIRIGQKNRVFRKKT